jgi:hypothetical protein
VEIDAEVVSLVGLIPPSSDRDVRQVAEPQRSNASVSDHGNIARLVLDERVLETLHDSGLGVDRPLPSLVR